MHKHVVTAKNVHILFYEQAVCRKCIKMENALVDEGK